MAVARETGRRSGAAAPARGAAAARGAAPSVARRGIRSLDDACARRRATATSASTPTAANMITAFTPRLRTSGTTPLSSEVWSIVM